MFKTLQPQGWKPPKGYAHGLSAHGQLVVLGGQVGWNQDQEFETDDFVEQTEQALRNIVALLEEANAGPEHIVRMTWFITDRQAYVCNQRVIGEAYRRVIGRNFPAMSVVQVVKLIEERALVEIEATAMVPNP